MGESGGVRCTIDGRVAQVVLDLPPVNIVGADLIVGLFPLLDELEASDVSVAVFRSADPDFFLMHGDVEMLAAMPPSEPVAATEPNVAAALFQRIHTAPYLSIGVVDGIARGGGCEMLSALDLRIGTPRTRIGQPEVPMGILPGAGGTSRWPWFAGRGSGPRADPHRPRHRRRRGARPGLARRAGARRRARRPRRPHRRPGRAPCRATSWRR